MILHSIIWTFSIISLIFFFKFRKEECYKDSLTKIFNRRFLNIVMKKEIRKYIDHNKDLGFLMIDIDDFKHYNDCYGHSVGDEILKTISLIIKNSIRTKDSIIRWGGDEFVVVARNATIIETDLLAKRILKEIQTSKKIEVLNKQYFKPLTISIGSGNLSAVHTEKSKHKNLLIELYKQELLNNADKALYYAKQQGKNQSCIN